MGGKLLDIEYLEPVTAGKPIDRDKRKIREMLMIDRVKLVLLDQALNMRKLERDHTVRGKQVRHPCSEVVEIGNLRQHVVADDEIGLPPLGDEALARGLKPKNSTSVGIFFCTRRFCNVGSRLDANDRNINGRKC